MTVSTMSVDVDRASEFLLRHARLLERRRFAHRVDRPDPGGVAAAVLAYRNPDGGFGQALEPDCRTPHSQPQATRLALGALADVGRLDPEVAEGAAAWAATVLAPEGGLPFCLPTVVGYPRAPWWEPGGDPPPAGITPTGGLVGRLREAGVAAAWRDRAEAWCFAELDRTVAAGRRRASTTWRTWLSSAPSPSTGRLRTGRWVSCGSSWRPAGSSRLSPGARPVPTPTPRSTSPRVRTTRCGRPSATR